MQLRPFDDAQIGCFVDAWYGHMAALARLTEADARDRAATLKGEVRRNPRLRELAERPLLLTLIAQLQTKGGGALPQRREALYDAAVTMLLHTWEKLKPRTAPDGTAWQEPSQAWDFFAAPADSAACHASPAICGSWAVTLAVAAVAF